MKIVFLTGAGISAPSGIPTFRCEGGLWSSVDIKSVATAEAIEKNPISVVKFWDDKWQFSFIKISENGLQNAVQKHGL